MALIKRQQKTTEATHWPGQIPMNYVYTAGRAGEVFFKNLKDKGVFTAAVAKKSGRVYMPPRTFCEQTFERLEDNFVTVENKGVVHTFAICHETYDEKRKEEPSLVAFIRFEGTHGGLTHWLGEVDPDDVYIGMPVEAVLKSKKERKGSILDIKYFRPIQ